jgi:glycosyl transferase family 25
MNHFNQFFDKIYCINLERRQDRFRRAKEIFEKLGITVKFFKAMDGKQMFSEIRYPFAAEIATALSHIAVWKTAQKLNLKNVLIFEDDVVFDENINEVLPRYMEALPENWDMLYFGANHIQMPVFFNNRWLRIVKSYATHCYALNQKAFQPLIDISEREVNKALKNHADLSGSVGIDLTISFMQLRLDCYCANPKLAWQAVDYSDIQESIVNYDSCLKP